MHTKSQLRKLWTFRFAIILSIMNNNTLSWFKTRINWCLMDKKHQNATQSVIIVFFVCIVGIGKYLKQLKSVKYAKSAGNIIPPLFLYPSWNITRHIFYMRRYSSIHFNNLTWFAQLKSSNYILFNSIHKIRIHVSNNDMCSNNLRKYNKHFNWKKNRHFLIHRHAVGFA